MRASLFAEIQADPKSTCITWKHILDLSERTCAFSTGQLICKGYGATVPILMRLVFMCMAPLLWITTVFGWLLSLVFGSMLRFASLSETDHRNGSTSVVLFRNQFSRACRNVFPSLDGHVSPANTKFDRTRNQPRVGSGFVRFSLLPALDEPRFIL
jgi:hypothetical protein